MADATPLSVQAPAGDPKGGLVVIQEAFGVNEHIEDVCRRLAAEGWLAVAPHLFHRSGDPKLGYDDFSQVMPHMQALTAEGVLSDVDVAIAHLEEAGIPRPRIGVTGFCMGGTVTLATAVEREVGAGVTFYGGGVREGRFGFPSGIELAPRLRAPWLGLYGDLDQSIAVDDVEELRAAAASSGQPTEVVRYAGAGHGFNCDQRDSYHAASAADAWSRTLAWFDRYLLT
jgi:carboxymethylenebutenolidase